MLWINTAVPATIRASKLFNCLNAIKMNGRFTDMLPFSPGNLTLSRDETAAATARPRNSQRCHSWVRAALWITALTAPSAIRPTTIGASRELPLITWLLATVLMLMAPVFLLIGSRAVAPHYGVTPNHGVSPNHAITGHCAVTPNHGVTPHDRVSGENAASPNYRIAPHDRVTPNH